MRELALANPDLKIVIEYKPREPRNKMFWDSAAKTALGIKAMGVDNVGVLLDFGHALFGGESPAAAAQLLIDHGLLWGMDVNDNLRGWDDDMVVGTVHPVELFEFFYTLRKNGWEGVWQLDQFPFREDTRRGRAALDPVPQGDVPSPREPRHRGPARSPGTRGRSRRATRRPGRSLRGHGGGVVTIEEEEDLVPHVDPSALPGGELPVLGRAPAGASREQAVAHLAEAARQVRRRDIQMVHAAGLGHIGGEFSVIDILVTLYLHAMNMSPGQLGDPERDRFILSKGHAAAALYTTLAVAGFLPAKDLATFMQPNSLLNGHPARTKIEAVEASTGPSDTGCRSPWAPPSRASSTDRRAVRSSWSVTASCRKARTGRR